MGKNLKSKSIYFGLNEPKYYKDSPEHATDSIFCLNCQSRLTYKGFYYSHIGIWSCNKCGFKRPNPKYSKAISKLPGLYNSYNAIAAYAALNELKVPARLIEKSLIGFSPAFGRQEKFTIYGKKTSIFLSKNPAGFNQAIETVLSLKAKNILIVLNDRIPDGRDVSWIWDVDFEKLSSPAGKNITLSGDRVYDLALRLKYAEANFFLEENLKKAIIKALSQTKQKETLYILPTYSAMLEVRKILTGKKIL